MAENFSFVPEERKISVTFSYGMTIISRLLVQIFNQFNVADNNEPIIVQY